MKIIHGVGGGEPEYTSPVLLSELGLYEGQLQYDYICSELLSMKVNGELFVTDLLAQPSRVRDAVGLALKGMYYDPESFSQRVSSTPLPPELSGHLVKIRCAKDSSGKVRSKTVKFKSGVVRKRSKKNISGRRRMAVSGDGESYSAGVVQNVDEWVDCEASEYELALPLAWICLAQHGRHCRPASGAARQDILWLFEESDLPANNGGVQPKKVVKVLKKETKPKQKKEDDSPLPGQSVFFDKGE